MDNKDDTKEERNERSSRGWASLLRLHYFCLSPVVAPNLSFDLKRWKGTNTVCLWLSVCDRMKSTDLVTQDTKWFWASACVRTTPHNLNCRTPAFPLQAPSPSIWSPSVTNCPQSSGQRPGFERTTAGHHEEEVERGGGGGGGVRPITDVVKNQKRKRPQALKLSTSAQSDAAIKA